MDIADLLLPLDDTSDIALHRQVYQGLRHAVVQGRLAPGARIPSSRRLAEYLAVSRTTVLAAFEQLVAEGFLVSTVGSGSRVSPHVPAPARTSAAEAAELRPGDLSQRGQALLALPRPDRRLTPGAQPFRTGQPPVDAFPLDVWRRLTTRRQRGLSMANLYHGPEQGLRQLRDAISTLAIGRGIRCDPGQVLVMASAQEAMELACRVLVDPGAEAWLEDPAWSGACAALVSAGAKVVPVPLDEDGLRIEVGVRAAPRARLAYVTPSHQYPTGVTMSIERRRRLLEWAQDSSAWILEDDYDSEFRYSNRPLPALKSLPNAERVIYVGTFNKVLFPTLRMAYLILPDSLVDAFRRVRGIGGQHSPFIDQAVLTDFIAEGHYARHLTRARVAGRERRDALISAARGIPELEFAQIGTGLHTVGWLPKGVDDRRISLAALAHGVEAAPLSSYCLGPCPRPGLVLGYGSVTPRQIRGGMRLLAKAIAESERSPES